MRAPGLTSRAEELSKNRVAGGRRRRPWAPRAGKRLSQNPVARGRSTPDSKSGAEKSSGSNKGEAPKGLIASRKTDTVWAPRRPSTKPRRGFSVRNPTESSAPDFSPGFGQSASHAEAAPSVWSIVLSISRRFPIAPAGFRDSLFQPGSPTSASRPVLGTAPSSARSSCTGYLPRAAPVSMPRPFRR